MSRKDTCEWIRDENGIYDTACSNMYEITYGTPKDNHMEYCPYCGKRIEEKDNG